MRLLFLIFVFFLQLHIQAQEVFVINTKVSKVEWLGRKLTGEHNGDVQVKSGTLTIQDGHILSGNIVIDMNSIQVLDIENKNSNAKLMDVFKSEEFFYPEKYNTASLKIKRVNVLENQTQEILGTLTIKDVSKEIRFNTQVLAEENKLVFIGTIEIDRTDFDIKFGSGFFSSLGDNAIKDLFKITFKIAASKQ